MPNKKLGKSTVQKYHTDKFKQDGFTKIYNQEKKS